MKKGFFFVVDGPDGVGKTTLIHNVIKDLKKHHGWSAVYSSEPTRGPLGMRIRELAKNGGSKSEILKLFLSDRKEHVKEFIQPALKKNKIVFSDRYKYSTVCYQHLQGFSIKNLVKKNRFLSPDIAFIVYAEYPVLKARLSARNSSREIFEKDDYLKKSVALYKRMNKYFPRENFIFVEADKSRQAMCSAIVKEIVKKIKSV